MSHPSEKEEIATVARLFSGMGASSEQAEVMATQLLKRAEQLAEERGISKVAALESLLKRVIEAQQGG